MRRLIFVVVSIGFVASTLIHLYAQLVSSAPLIEATIWLPMLCLLFAFVLAVGVWDLTATATAVGLGFSLLGDALGEFSLMLKIGLFLVAQVSFVVGFTGPWLRGRTRRWWVVAGYLAVTAVLIAVLAPMAGTLTAAVVVYGAALGAMACLSTGLGWWGGLGGLLFLVSDTLLGIDLFRGSVLPSQGLLIMVTYLVAQLLLAIAVLRRNHR